MNDVDHDPLDSVFENPLLTQARVRQAHATADRDSAIADCVRAATGVGIILVLATVVPVVIAVWRWGLA